MKVKVRRRDIAPDKRGNESEMEYQVYGYQYERMSDERADRMGVRRDRNGKYLILVSYSGDYLVLPDMDAEVCWCMP